MASRLVTFPFPVAVRVQAKGDLTTRSRFLAHAVVTDDWCEQYQATAEPADSELARFLTPNAFTANAVYIAKADGSVEMVLTEPFELHVADAMIQVVQVIDED